MKFTDKKIGIWGFGIVGKAALNYFSSQEAQLTIMDQRPLTNEEAALIAANKANFLPQEFVGQFLEEHDFILPSPGIDLKKYQHYQAKFISELDIFAQHFKKPIIAITGTAGKTTTTSLLAHILSCAGVPIITGGNIGTGMLDLLRTDQAQKAAYAILEVSSFQLELCKSFAPYIGVWLNFFPNHLDRHATAQEYFAAKHKLLDYQEPNSYAILPLELIDQIDSLSKNTNNKRIFFSSEPLVEQRAAHLKANDSVFYLDQGMVFKKINQVPATPVISLKNIPAITVTSNIVALVALLEALNIDLSSLPNTLNAYQKYPHRLELVLTKNNIDWYNDSKSTIMESTLAAVQQLQQQPLILLLGGLSKGVDRAPLFEAIKNKVKMVICFGKEAHLLHEVAMRKDIPSIACATLEDATIAAKAVAITGDQVLLSPAGSSYDLFKNYEERGNRFKELIIEPSHTKL